MARIEDRTAVLLIAHGSRSPAANDDLHRLAGRLADRGGYPVVVASFLELAEPDIPTAGGQCVTRGARRVLMVPYFLSAGVHVRRDVGAAVEGIRARHPELTVELLEPIGQHPRLVEALRDIAAAELRRIP